MVVEKVEERRCCTGGVHRDAGAVSSLLDVSRGVGVAPQCSSIKGRWTGCGDGANKLGMDDKRQRNESYRLVS